LAEDSVGANTVQLRIFGTKHWSVETRNFASLQRIMVLSEPYCSWCKISENIIICHSLKPH